MDREELKNWIIKNCFRDNTFIKRLGNDKHFIKVFNDEYYNIIEETKFLDNVVKISERLYCILNDIRETQVCRTCGNAVKFYRLSKGYLKFCCNRCVQLNPEIREKIENTTIERFGKKCSLQNEEVKNKIKYTNLERYGHDNPLKCKDIQQKIKETNLKLRGSEYPTNSHLDRIQKDILSNPELIYNLHLEKEIPLSCLSKQLGFSETLLGKVLRQNGYEVKRFKKTYPEKLVFEFLQENGIDFKFNSFNIIYPLQLDFYLEEFNIGIEINGLYFHREGFKREKYHILDKYNICKDKGIRLLNFYDVEIDNKFEIVKSIILNAIGKTKNRIYARKCKIKEVDLNITIKFYNDNHIQGKGTNSKYNYGLFLDEELVSCMSISTSKISKYKNSNVLELVRFASKLNTNVIGGFDRLLKYHIKLHDDKLMSFVDKRLFTGEGYLKNNFYITNESSPNYFYFKTHKNLYKLHSRWMFQKHKLKEILENYDECLSEYENMRNNGWYRIYDCGNLVLEYKSKDE